MSNFICFRFTDNDFHSVLRKAVEYVARNMEDDEMSTPAWTEFVIRAAVGFHSIHRISDWGLKHHVPIKRAYFDQYLTVFEVNKLAQLPDNFEGFVFDKNTKTVFYSGI